MRGQYIESIEQEKVRDMATVFNNSDHSLTQLHVALSVIHEGIELGLTLEELKVALYAAIRTRRE